MNWSQGSSTLGSIRKPIMDDPHARRRERDQALVRSLCDITRRLRRELVDWLELELKDQKYHAQLVQAMLPNGLIKDRAKEYEESIDDLSFRWLPDAIKEQQGRLDEIWREFNDDPFDDYMYLEESIFRIERMARMVYAMRRHLDVLSDSDVDEPGATDENGETAPL